MSVEQFIQEFHLLRPWALLLAPVAIALFYLLYRLKTGENQWHKYIDAKLLQQLSVGEANNHNKQGWLWPAILASLLLSLALSGPSWQKVPQPIHKKQDALVILLDLSPSMMAEDIKPSRLVRSRYKLVDLLKQRTEGKTALIAYGGEAHTVSPLTDDTDTIINLLPALSPGIIPLAGSNTEMAVEKAIQLLRDAGHSYGNILLLSDGVVNNAVDTIGGLLDTTDYRLSVLSVGTKDGGPIPTRSGFAKDNSGAIVIAALKQAPLRQLASDNRGIYQQMTSSDRDIDSLQSFWQRQLQQADSENQEREFDQWQDEGYWFAIPALLLFMLNFRRGYFLTVLPLSCVSLLALLLMAQFLLPGKSYAQEQAVSEPEDPKTSASSTLADTWQALWKNKAQRGYEAFQQQDYDKAEKLFEDPRWRGASNAKQGDFKSAIQEFAKGKSADDFYNKGNAQALSGNIDAAIQSYEQSLKLAPENEDAKANKELLEKLKQQQQQQDQGQNQDQQNQSGEQQQNQQGDSNQQQGEPGQQKQDQQNSDSQSQDSKQQQDKDKGEENSQQGKSKKDEQNPKQEQQGSQQQAQQGKPNGKEPSQEELQQQAAQMAAQQDKLSDEQRQALEQWLQQVPDDPSGLMRRKFQYQYDQRRRAYRQGQWQPPQNNADKRW